jgi:hypothetical protein
MRPWVETVYGIPPEQVIGSKAEVKYEYVNGKPVIQYPKVAYYNDKTNKPIGLFQNIGRRPIAAFGHSDGDLNMLEWTAAEEGLSFKMIVHHAEAERGGYETRLASHLSR